MPLRLPSDSGRPTREAPRGPGLDVTGCSACPCARSRFGCCPRRCCARARRLPADEAKLAEHLGARRRVRARRRSTPRRSSSTRTCSRSTRTTPRPTTASRSAYLRNRQAREGFWELQETVRLDPTNLDAQARVRAVRAPRRARSEEALTQADEVIAADPERATGLHAEGAGARGARSARRGARGLREGRRGRARRPDARCCCSRTSTRAQGRREGRGALPKLIEVAAELRGVRRARGLPGRATSARDAEDARRPTEGARARRSARSSSAPTRALASFYYSRERFDDAETLLERGHREGRTRRRADLHARALLPRARRRRRRRDELIAARHRGEARRLRSRSSCSRPTAAAAATRGRARGREQALKVAPDGRCRAAAQGRAAARHRLPRSSDEAKIEEGREIVDAVLAGEARRTRSALRQGEDRPRRRSARRRDRVAAPRARPASRTGPRRTSCWAPRCSCSGDAHGRAHRAGARARARRRPRRGAQAAGARARGARRARARRRGGPPLPEAAARRPSQCGCCVAQSLVNLDAPTRRSGRARDDRRGAARRRGQLRARRASTCAGTSSQGARVSARSAPTEQPASSGDPAAACSTLDASRGSRWRSRSARIKAAVEAEAGQRAAAPARRRAGASTADGNADAEATLQEAPIELDPNDLVGYRAAGALLLVDGPPRRDGDDLRARARRSRPDQAQPPPLPRRALRATAASATRRSSTTRTRSASTRTSARRRTTSRTCSPRPARTSTARSTSRRRPSRCCRTTRTPPTRSAGCSTSAASPRRRSAT